VAKRSTNWRLHSKNRETSLMENLGLSARQEHELHLHFCWKIRLRWCQF
jgi:hypothetical protein